LLISEKCKKLIDQGATITLLTNLNQDEVFAEFKKSHIFILPSEKEPASISQIEAMAHGLPVIISKDNGTRYVVREGVNGFLVNPNQEDIYNIFRYILDKKDTLLHWSLNALNTIANEYS